MTTFPSSELFIDLYIPLIALPDQLCNDEATPGDKFTTPMFARRDLPEKLLSR